MANAYGFIEITGVTAAVNALDIMCKAAEVRFVAWEPRLGGRLVTIIIEGKVADVKEAVEAAKANDLRKPAAVGVIASPHQEIVRLIAKRRAGDEPGIEQGTDCPDSTEHSQEHE